MPFVFLAKVPMLSDIIPVRFSVATAACVAAVLAFALDRIHRGERALAGAGGWVAGQPNGRATRGVGGRVPGGRGDMAAGFAVCEPIGAEVAAAVVRALPAGDPLVLTYPYPVTASDSAMVWQAEAGFPLPAVRVCTRWCRKATARPRHRRRSSTPTRSRSISRPKRSGSRSDYPRPSPNVDMVGRGQGFRGPPTTWTPSWWTSPRPTAPAWGTCSFVRWGRRDSPAVVSSSGSSERADRRRT